MRLQSVQALKRELVDTVVTPYAERASRLRLGADGWPAGPGDDVHEDFGPAEFAVSARSVEHLPRVARSLALGVTRRRKQYQLAIRVQRAALLKSPLVDRLVAAAKGEADVRFIGRIDKRGTRATTAAGAARAVSSPPWYQGNTRPLNIGASVGHVDITAGTLGAFVKLGQTVCLLSNNHVLANEDRAAVGDWILQRARYDGGKEPAERVAQLRAWARLDPRRANVIDAAIAEIKTGIAHDATMLRDLVKGMSRKLTGVAPAFVDEGETVYKVGRTTGATMGRVTAFNVDNIVVNYDAGNLRFDDQLEIEGTGTRSFSDGGDSGSLIVNADFKAVGLLFAGGDTGGANGMGLTFANPIHRVLGDLKVSLLF